MFRKKINFSLEPELLDEISRTGKLLSFRQGETIVQNEKYVRTIPLILKGTVKVLRVDENGSELFLYYLKDGQSCAVSLSSCLANKPSNIKAVAEEETELIAVSSENTAKWFGQFSSWRDFVLLTLNERFEELIKTIDNIAFLKTDERLVKLLSAKSAAFQTTTIRITHQQIADELASSREVISRLLKQLEQKGLVKLSRNKIKLFFPV